MSSRGRVFLECGHCGLVRAAGEAPLSVEEKRKRYLLHENSAESAGYREFLSQAIRPARPYLVPGARGLDFGCGPGPVLSMLLREEGFVMDDYDPLFFDGPLRPPYDFVFSTECFEHFEDPAGDIAEVVTLVRDGGVLAVMTELWDDSVDFGRWAYTYDETHVSFYSLKTFGYIGRKFGVRLVAGDNRRVMVFRKNGSNGQ
ncbi:MAG: class I SAM-dependent methyltransferase [Candidatus Omnitrophica bacterium]|nr:class I SAM-dependent methyltransferase [Candidatus Omnitrophota bacterium]